MLVTPLRTISKDVLKVVLTFYDCHEISHNRRSYAVIAN